MAALLVRTNRGVQAGRLLERVVPVFRKQQMSRELRRAEQLMAAVTSQSAGGG
jgi:hypothetical protein